jgi:Uma2 family endonuclease
MVTASLEQTSLEPDAHQKELPVLRSPLAPALNPNWSLADLQDHLGGIPFSRICLDPSPGRATEQDFLALLDSKTRLAELIDGTLVEKAVGFFESRLAVVFLSLIDQFVLLNKLGLVFGADCPIRLFPDQVRMPDTCFVSWSRFPHRKMPDGQILGIAPDLAIEVISPSNTTAEMDRKLNEYFRVGVRLVWYVYPITMTIRVFKSPTDFQDLKDDQILNGGDVLPGFELSVMTLFDRAMGI